MALDSTSGEIQAIAAAVSGGSSSGGTSLLTPGAPFLGYRAGRKYLASAPVKYNINTIAMVADKMIYLPAWQVPATVTFTSLWVYVSATGGSARFSYYNALTGARIAQLGNITLSSTGLLPLNSLSVTLAKGDIVSFGVNFSGTPTLARMDIDADAATANQNFSLVGFELGIPSYTTNPASSNPHGARSETETHVYTGTTTPSTMAPTADSAVSPCIWLSN